MKNEKVYFWPDWFRDSLPLAKRSQIKPSLIIKLGRANRYLWRALNIYDDFLDGTGERDKLPLANSYYRRYLEIYYRLNLDANFYRLFNQVMADSDLANRQEVFQNKQGGLKINNGRIILPKNLLRFTNLSNLSRKSLALGLGTIAILYISEGGQSDRAQKKIKIKAAINFFCSALAAKQLADDSQDWFEDLQNGTVTAANVLVLRAAKKRHLNIDLKRQPEIAYLLFATSASAKISHDLKKLCQQAKIYGSKINLNSNSRLITEIIGPIENGLTEVAEFRAHWLKNPKKML